MYTFFPTGKHPQHILIYPFEELFAYVSQSVMFQERGETNIAQAISNLEKDPNAYRNGFGCEVSFVLLLIFF